MEKRQYKINFLKITLASPLQIEKWGTRYHNGLPVGEIQNSEIINPETRNSNNNGLFCKKIFGVEKNNTYINNSDFLSNTPLFQNKSLKNIKIEKKNNLDIINKLNLNDKTYSKNLSILPYQMGFIKLSTSIVHSWYLHNKPSFISLLLNIEIKQIKKIVYFKKNLNSFEINNIKIYNDNLLYFYKINKGANTIKYLLNNLNLKYELFYSRLLLNLYQLNFIKFINKQNIINETQFTEKNILIKRIRLLENFITTKAKPSWMILDILPVIPPLLRPLHKDNNKELIPDDLNVLYANIIRQNNKLLKFLNNNIHPAIIANEIYNLQTIIDLLIHNNSLTNENSNNTFLKSISTNFIGKYGRFRHNLLGKRVDYSGRSVIVVGPYLKLNQCGIPYELSIELFKPFIIRDLIDMQITTNLKKANEIRLTEKNFIYHLVKGISRKKVILLNRAPTLHKLGIQAFEPKIVNEKAINLHPLVCSAFNADFDGDQMAVHLPLTIQAQKESKKLIFIPQNIISSTTSEPIILPTQDLIMGYAYLTNTISLFSSNYRYFNSYTDLLIAYEQQQITLHSAIWIRNINFKFLQKYNISKQIKKKKLKINTYILTTFGRLLLHKIIKKNLYF